MNKPQWIAADWPAPVKVHAGSTTRKGGVSKGRYESFNLAQHVDDDRESVEKNRAYLRKLLDLPSEPHWLSQMHGCDVSTDSQLLTQADAAITTEPGKVCVVMTADCLPVLLCDRAGTCVAAVHAGWRGLATGVITRTVAAMPVAREQLMVWLGPAIGPEAFEVGDEVRAEFVSQHERFKQAFEPHVAGKWRMDIYQAARIQLNQLGIDAVYGGGFCTYRDAEQFYSYRRDKQTGRMASLIWIQPSR